jgi:UDP-3-O-[3-hydroxymyristoyl] glucosamine N-acyltransferase
MPSFTVARLAELAGGTAVGETERLIDGIVALQDRAGYLISPLLRKSMTRHLTAPLAGAVIATAELTRLALQNGVPAAIVHTEPLIGLAWLIDVFYPEAQAAGSVHPSAVVAPGARVHPSARVGANAVIEAGAEVGEGTWIGPGAVICGCAVIGRFVRIGPNAVIGHEGFGFVPSAPIPTRIRHVGNVLVEDFVDIGACACVDRGTLGSTVIRTGAKIDNLVQIGHNAEVGRGALIAAQSGLAGSTRIGDGAMLGGQVGVADHRRIGAGARVAGQSGVIGDVADGESVFGTPAMQRVRWLRAIARLAPRRPGSAETGKATEET